METFKTVLSFLVPLLSSGGVLYLLIKKQIEKSDEKTKQEIKSHIANLKEDSGQFVAQIIKGSRKEALINRWLDAVRGKYGAQHAWLGLFHNGVIMSNNDHLIKMTAPYEWPMDLHNSKGELLSVRRQIVELPLSTMGDYKNKLISDMWHHTIDDTVSNPVMAHEFKRWELVENINVMLYHNGSPIAVLGLNWTDNGGVSLVDKMGFVTSVEVVRAIRTEQDGLVDLLINE